MGLKHGFVYPSENSFTSLCGHSLSVFTEDNIYFIELKNT